MDLNMIRLAAKETQPGTALGLGPVWVQATEACHKTECCMWELFFGSCSCYHEGRQG